MAGEFVIEALEPRQFLSGTPVITPPPVPAGATQTILATKAPLATAVTVSVTTSAGSTSAANATKNPAFVRPGSTDTTGTTASTTEITSTSSIPWGTDIYPPPVFTETSGQGTHRTSAQVGPAVPTGTTSSTKPPTSTTILLGRHSGKHVSKHFSVRPDDEHAGQPSGTVVRPQIASNPATMQRVQHFTTGVFSGTARALITQAPARPTRAQSPTSSVQNISIANWTSSGTSVVHSPFAGHALPDIALTSHLSGALSAESAPSGRAPRLVPANGFDGLLLPLATMDDSLIVNAGTKVGKWEVNVALGSLAVVICGYWYLCDVAARKRQHRATPVSIFCEKPIE